MPSIKEDKMALDWLADNHGDNRAPAVAGKLGLTPTDVQAWKWAKDNPADMRAIQVRNKVYDVVAETRPSAVDEQGGEIRSGVPVDRLAIKNLLDNDPEAQKAYLEKKGFKTRTSTSGELMAKGPGESYYKAIDPEGIDRWDAADLITDTLSGLAIGGTASKAAGPAGVAIGAGLGAASGAGTELAKQGIARVSGLRDDFNFGEMARQGMIGAVIPPAVDAAGGLLKVAGSLAGKAVTKLTGSGLKPNAEAIEAASEAIGAKATPGQLFEGEVVKKLEDSQRQAAGLIGGMGLRKQIEANVKAAKQTADDIVDSAAAKSAFEMGDEIGTKLKTAVTKRLQPAEEIYKKYEDELADKAIDQMALNGVFAAAKTEARLNPDAVAAISRFETVLKDVKNIDDLKLLRTEIGSAKRSAAANKNWAVANRLGDVESGLTDLRSQSILNAFDDTAKGDLVRAEIQAADKIYASTIRDLENVVGKKINKGSPKAELNSFLEKTPEISRINKVLKTNDPKQINKLRESFPEVFEAARAAKLAEIAKKAQPGEEINPRTLAKTIAALPPESKILLLGEDAAKKADALKTYLDSLPGKLVGPSGTPEGLRWLDIMNLINPLYYAKQAFSLGQPALSHIYTAAPLGKDIFTTTGRAARTPVAKIGTAAAAQAGALNSLLPKPLEGGQ